MESYLKFALVIENLRTAQYFAFFKFYAHTKWMNLDMIVTNRCMDYVGGVRSRMNFLYVRLFVRVNDNTMHIIFRMHSTSESSHGDLFEICFSH